MKLISFKAFMIMQVILLTMDLDSAAPILYVNKSNLFCPLILEHFYRSTPEIKANYLCTPPYLLDTE